MKEKILWIGAIAIIVGAVWYLKNADELDPISAASISVISPTAKVGSIEREEPLPAPTESQPLAVVVPSSLDGSDASVKVAVADFSPELLQWLTPKNQIQKWVMLVDQIADGAVPNQYQPLSYAMVPFKAQQEEDKWIVDSTNYARANTLIDLIAATPPPRLAAYYRSWYPLLNDAYRDLGRGDGFDKRLRIAIDRVLTVKPLSEQPVMKRPGVYYQYADPQYENASALEKLLWRLGPKNTARLQEFLRNLKAAI